MGILRQQAFHEFQAERRRLPDEIGIVVGGEGPPAVGERIADFVDGDPIHRTTTAGEDQKEQSASQPLRLPAPAHSPGSGRPDPDADGRAQAHEPPARRASAAGKELSCLMMSVELTRMRVREMRGRDCSRRAKECWKTDRRKAWKGRAGGTQQGVAKGAGKRFLRGSAKGQTKKGRQIRRIGGPALQGRALGFA